MSNQYKFLFQPLKIGPVTVKNRIAMAPMGTSLAKDIGAAHNRLPSLAQAYYYAERAKGGTGLIIMEATLIHPTSYSPLVLAYNYDKSVIPGFKKITEMVHENGAKIFVQLCHFGRQNISTISRRPLLAPSPIPCPTMREVPKEMEKEDIEEIVQAWGSAAKRAKQGGFDGVELHSLHTGYLACQFVSSLTNKRTDEYGGTFEKRMRFLYEVIDSMRENIGPNLALGVRLSVELVPGGLTLEDIKEVAIAVEATGKVDYIHVDAGCYTVLYKLFPRVSDPDNIYSDFAAGVKQVVKKLPVFAVGKIRSPKDADALISQGKADLVVLGRSLIADPEWANKTKAGKAEDIRPCIACNEQCLGRLFRFTPISCIHNPAVGHEEELGIGTIKPAKKKKRLLVVGGGPGGLEAARVAATRGLDVSLYEKRERLGGAALLASKIPGSEFNRVIQWQEDQIRKLGVKIYLNAEVTAEFVENKKFDVVVLATGAIATKPLIAGADRSNVFNERQVMSEEIELGNHIVIVDGGWGFWQCCGVSEYLADKGKKIEVVTPLLFVGQEISGFEIPPLYQRLLSKDVTFTPNSAVKEISKKDVTIYNVYSGKENIIKDVDSVVFSWYAQANDGLYKELKGRIANLYRIGDCLAPRRMEQAIYEGDNIGRSV